MGRTAFAKGAPGSSQPRADERTVGELPSAAYQRAAGRRGTLRAMARRPQPKLEDKLAALSAMERGTADVDPAVVRDGLDAKIGLVVAAAARVIAAREVEAMIPELGPAFTRLCERGVERDAGCRGKVAIARALHDLDRWDDEVFVPGVRLVQHEPVWGGREDTAAELRGVCAMAFAHAHRPDALDVLADLLADPERMARVAAAQALGDSGRPDASALLRYKVRMGDAEPEVIAAALGSLLVLAPRASFELVASLLHGESDTATAAALALGESKRAEAAPLLIAWCDEISSSVRARVGYLALALLRDEVATGFLLAQIRDARDADAIAAARALATFRSDDKLAARIRDAAAGARAPVRAAVAAALAE